MARERKGNGRPKDGRANGPGKPPAAPPAPPEETTPSAPPPAECRPEEIPEDFKFLSSFLPEDARERAAEPDSGGSTPNPNQPAGMVPDPAAASRRTSGRETAFPETSGAEPGPFAAGAEEAPSGEIPGAPPVIAFPSEESWQRSGSEEETPGSDLLSFRIAEEEYAIDIQRVWEIIRPRTITEIPGVPEFISGIIALRGEIVPVLDLRRRLGFPAAEVACAGAKIVVAIHDGRRIGMAVDAVSHKIHVRDAQVTQPAALLGGQESGFLTGVCRHQGRLIAILDADAVLAFRIDTEAGRGPSGLTGAQEAHRAQGGTR